MPTKKGDIMVSLIFVILVRYYTAVYLMTYRAGSYKTETASYIRQVSHFYHLACITELTVQK